MRKSLSTLLAVGSLTLAEVAERTGASRRSITAYINKGAVSPPLGRTRAARYFPSHVDEVLELKSALEKGLTVDAFIRKKRLAAVARIGDTATAEHLERFERLRSYRLRHGLTLHTPLELTERQLAYLQKLLQVV